MALYRKLQIALFMLCCLGLTAQATQKPSTLAQIQACRATSSLLVLRGEGFPAKHKLRLEGDLAAIANTLQNSELASDNELQSHYHHLVDLLHQGRDFGPSDESVPWSYSRDLNQALNSFLARADELGEKDDQNRLALQLEYLGVQYLSRAYLGDYEIPRELNSSYLSQDETGLTPVIQQGFEQYASRLDPLQAKQILDRWRYLKQQLDDLNTQAASLSSRSGRPFVPMIVDRQTRLLSEALLGQQSH